MTAYQDLPASRLRYGVVLNDLSLDNQPTELGGWRLERARPDVVHEFRDEILRYAAPIMGWRPPQEMTITLGPQDGITFVDQDDPSEWRYFIVRPITANAISGRALQTALRLSEADLWVEKWSATPRLPRQKSEWTVGGNPIASVVYFSQHGMEPTPDALDMEELASTVGEYATLETSDYPRISRSIELFMQLDVVFEHADVKALGYFAVLESLLSHAPAASDTVDTITRQLRRNLILLDHRMPEERNLQLGSFVDTTGPEQVVGKLYSYRSSLAHGGDGSTHLEWLQRRRPSGYEQSSGKGWLHTYLRTVVRRVLKAAVREPRLLTDLRGT